MTTNPKLKCLTDLKDADGLINFKKDEVYQSHNSNVTGAALLTNEQGRPHVVNHEMPEMWLSHFEVIE